MNAFDYMKLVSEYIINKLESKRDLNESINFDIKPVRDLFTNELFYEIKEVINYKYQTFYLKFPCLNKDDFYNAVRQLIIEYIKNNEILMYTATSKDNLLNNTFSIKSKTLVNINFILEDATDELIFNQFNEYLVMKDENNDLEEELDENVSNVLVKKYEKTTAE